MGEKKKRKNKRSLKRYTIKTSRKLDFQRRFSPAASLLAAIRR